MRTRAAVFVLVLSLTTVVLAQAQQGPAPGFEVASVRQNTSLDRSYASGQPDGGFAAVNVTLRNLLVAAYSLPSSRILGGPDWVDSERYDVLAKGPRLKSAPVNLQALLSERFALVIRRERRDYPAYLLVKANADGRLGPNLRPARFDCSKADGRAAAAAANSKDSKSPTCGVLQGPGRILAGSVALNNIVGYLGTGRPVLDRTGLQGLFDIVLEWTPTPDADGISIFTAVREQLGLRLDNGRTTLDTIVIERAERPQ